MASDMGAKWRTQGDSPPPSRLYRHLPEFNQKLRRFDPAGCVHAPDPQQIASMTAVLRRLRLERKRKAAHRPDLGADLSRSEWEDDE